MVCIAIIVLVCHRLKVQYTNNFNFEKKNVSLKMAAEFYKSVCSRFWWEKFLWFLAVVTSFGFFAYMVNETIQDANKNQLTTTIESLPVQVERYFSFHRGKPCVFFLFFKK